MIHALYRSLGSLRAWITVIIGAVAATANWRSPSLANAAAPPGAASSSLSHRKHTLPLLALLAAAALGLALLLPGGALQAQSSTIEFPENSKEPVATFTATDPEGATPIAWLLATAEVDIDGDGTNDIVTADIADATHFTIDAEDGMLKFSTPPDYENPSGEGASSNTYKVVVAACDLALDAGACPTAGKVGYHKVTVEVTNVNETGTVTLVGTLSDGSSAAPAGTPPQYLVGAVLTATAKDGDIKQPTQTFTDSTATGVSGVTWRWYRGGTEITGTDAQDNTYTLQSADDGHRIRAVAYYIVDGNTNQEMAQETTDYPVLAARSGANQLKFDPARVSRTISEGAKDRNVGAPVTATGNHGAVRYSLENSGDATTGSAKFEIDEETGQITTAVKLNFEGTAGGADSCTAGTTCTVTVIARDSTGDSTSATASNLNATVTITITDVDEVPAFSTGAQTISVPENSKDLYGAAADGYSVGGATGDVAVSAVTYTAEDPERAIVNYSLTGPDASMFQISNVPPVLSFVSGADFEAKASADRDNVYEVTVRASAGGATDEQMVRVTVGNVDEGPDISGPSTRNFAENSKEPVATFTATDPEGATPIAWLLATAEVDIDGDGTNDIVTTDIADATHFTIDAEDGMLKFSTPPDYENPSGEGASSNTYKVVVAACDLALDAGACPTAGKVSYHKVTVEVTNVNETGTVTLVGTLSDGSSAAPAGTPPQYLVGAVLTATAKDGDIKQPTQTFTDSTATGVSGVTWRWYRGGTEITGTDAQDNTYTLQSADDGHRIRVVARYQVDGNTNQEMAQETTDYPVLAARSGANQLKFDPARVSRTISEGAKDRNVGAPVTATGNHGAVRYSLENSGDATTGSAKFEIDEETGQITTAVKLNFEGTAGGADSCTAGTTCTVTVIARDSTGDSTSATASNLNATVTITITDVDEVPAFSTGAQTISVPENSKDLYGAAADGYSVGGATGDVAVSAVTYTAEDPEQRTVSYSLTGPDASKFQIRRGSSTAPVLSFVSGADFEAKASADRDNVYEVTVRASASGATGEQMVRVTVGNVDEAPVVTSGLAIISGPRSASYEENGTATVGTYDLAGPGADMATWSLEGDDSGDFMLEGSGTSRMLKFASSPDYERPADANTDNVYMVTIKAVSGTDMAMRDVTVTVTDVDDPVGDPLLLRYDVNPQNGEIEEAEVRAAIRDHLINNTATEGDVRRVIRLHFGL